MILFVVLIVTVVPFVSTEKECLEGWRKFEDRICYGLFTKELTFSQAETFCYEFGAELPTVHSKNEEKFKAQKKYLNTLIELQAAQIEESEKKTEDIRQETDEERQDLESKQINLRSDIDLVKKEKLDEKDTQIERL